MSSNDRCPKCGDLLHESIRRLYEPNEEIVCDRCNYIDDGEPDGCYNCGSQMHKTVECTVIEDSGAAYRCGYAYACGYHD